MIGLAALLFLVGIVAISKADQPFPYTFQWRVVVAAFVLVASVWPMSAFVGQRLPNPVRLSLLAVLLSVALWGSVDRAVSVATAQNYSGLDARGPTVHQMMDQLRREGLPKGRLVLMRPVGTNLPSLFDGLVNQLDAAGVKVRVDPNRGRIFGSQRVAQIRDADEIWTVVEQGSREVPLLREPGAHVIARTSPLKATEETELEQAQAKLSRQLGAARRTDLRDQLDWSLVSFVLVHVRGVDQTLAARVGQLNEIVEKSGACRCAVIARPGPAAPKH